MKYVGSFFLPRVFFMVKVVILVFGVGDVMIVVGLLIGVEELLGIGVVLLVVFGSSLLPNIGQRLGQSIRGIKQSAEDVFDEAEVSPDQDQKSINSKQTEEGLED